MAASGVPIASQPPLPTRRGSPLLMGSVRFRTLHRYGLATLDNPAYVDTLDRLFLADQPPLCVTRF